MDSDQRYAYMRNLLPKDWVPFKVIELLHGIRRDDALLWGDFRAWSLRRQRIREVLRPDEVNRHAFESYLQHAGLLPKRTAAARLGMTVESLQHTLAALEDKGAGSYNIQGLSPQVVTESLIREFHDLFPDLQYRLFNDHNDYCRQLHEAISKDLNISVTRALCETSEHLREEPIDYAYDHDCFTSAPIGLRYQVWLDFNKPMNLRPDACSLKFYVEHEPDLKPLVFAGRKPEVPVALRQEHV